MSTPQEPGAEPAAVFMRTGSLPRTPSGKVQRVATRNAWLAQTLMGVWRDDLGALAAPLAEEAAAAIAGTRLLLATLLAEVLRQPLKAVDVHAPLQDHRLDSLGLVEFQARVERHLGVALPLQRLSSGASLADLAAGWPELPSGPNSAKPQNAAMPEQRRRLAWKTGWPMR